jgi:hypothetical protein
MIDERRDILRPLAQRRNMNLYDVETIVEILPESACFNFFL